MLSIPPTSTEKNRLRIFQLPDDQGNPTPVGDIALKIITGRLERQSLGTGNLTQLAASLSSRPSVQPLALPKRHTERKTYQPHWLTTAVVSGAVTGGRSTADAVVRVTQSLLDDPIGCAEEVGVVVVDGLIATAATLTPYPPESARASQERTVDRLRPFADAYDAYTKAPLEQQVEMLSALGTTLVLPAGVAKGVKAVETLAQSQGPKMLRWIEETVRPHDGGFVYATPVRLPVNSYERIRAGHAATDRISFANAYDAGSGPRPLKPAGARHLDAAREKSEKLFNRWLEELPPVQLPEELPNNIRSFQDQANYALPGKVLGGTVEYVGENQSAIYFFRGLWTPTPYKAGGLNYSDRLKNIVEQIVKHSQEMGHREVYFLCPSRVPLPSVLVEQHYPVQAVGQFPLRSNPTGTRTLNMMRVDVEKSSLPIAPLSAEGTIEKSRVLVDQWLKGFPDVPFSKGLPSVQLPKKLPKDMSFFEAESMLAMPEKELKGRVQYVGKGQSAIYFFKSLSPKKYSAGGSDYCERLTNVVERIVEHSQEMGHREVYFLCTSKVPLPSVLLEQRYPVQAVSEFPKGFMRRLKHNGRVSIMRVDTERAPLRPQLVLESPVFEPEMSQISLPLGWKSSSK